MPGIYLVGEQIALNLKLSWKWVNMAIFLIIISWPKQNKKKKQNKYIFQIKRFNSTWSISFWFEGSVFYYFSLKWGLWQISHKFVSSLIVLVNQNLHFLMNKMLDPNILANSGPTLNWFNEAFNLVSEKQSHIRGKSLTRFAEAW